MYYILSCNLAANVMIHHIDHWKTSKDSFYLEIESIWSQTVRDGHPQTYAKEIFPHLCFSLGSWGKYWNYDIQKPVTALDLKTDNTQPFSGKPFVPNVWDWVLEKTEKYDWEKEFGPVYGKGAKLQKTYLEAKNLSFKNCLNIKYPKQTPAQKAAAPRPSYNDKVAKAMKQVRGVEDRGDEVQTDRFTPESFEKLKNDWINENGYTLRIPSLDDIIHVQPNFTKTRAQVKAEKKAGLQRILDSPAPGWATKYSTVMTWIDNIQDTSSIVFPAIKLLAKAAPKVFGKLIPIAGWLMLGNDILGVLNAVGRAPLAPMKSKRDVCKFMKQNPFTKKARLDRAAKVANYEPNFGDILQALQTTDQFIGVGLSLGAMMGTITDSIFAAYRYLNGEKVNFTFDPPNVHTWEKFIAKRSRAAAGLSSQGQLMSDQDHFWAYITNACATMLLTPLFIDHNMTELIENPADVLLEADRPEDPITLEVIKEAGLDLEKGVGFPWNDSKQITVKDFNTNTAFAGKEVFRDFSLRHEKDQYGYAAAGAMHIQTLNSIAAMEPDAELYSEDPDYIQVMFRMIKAPILPTSMPSPKDGQAFYEWIQAYKDATGHTPGLLRVEDKLTELGISWASKYPDKPTTQTDEIFGESFPWGTIE